MERAIGLVCHGFHVVAEPWFYLSTQERFLSFIGEHAKRLFYTIVASFDTICYSGLYRGRDTWRIGVACCGSFVQTIGASSCTL